MVSNRTEREDMVIFQDGQAFFFVVLRWPQFLSLILIVLDVDFTGLWLHLFSLSLLLFSRQSLNSVFLARVTILTPQQ